VTAAIALGLDAKHTATAIALAIPAAGGAQRAFGTASKALQVGFAADAGVRAAKLAAAGASADPSALDQWMTLVNADRTRVQTGAEAVPDGLAIKLFPCCYALQRPIAALKALTHRPPPETIERIRVYTPASVLQPLIHGRPTTGLEGKFSLEYAIAAFLTDGRADFQTFSDEAVRRPQVRKVMERVHTEITDHGDGLLAGEVTIEIELAEGETVTTTLDLPPGAPSRPPTATELKAKLEMCGAQADLTWETAAQRLTESVDPG
jgi:2-methylcitrate dehydratase PrpD